MNWKTAVVVVAASAVSAFAGAWLALNRQVLPEALQGPEPGAREAWAREIVTRVNQLERQNTELEDALSTTRERMTEIETVFVASGVDLEAAAEQLQNVRATLAETGSELSRVDTELSTTREQLEEFREEKEREEQELQLEDFIFIELNPINGVPGPHIIFDSVNVHIQSGAGATTAISGLGNLFIGYNEPGDGPRFGSHNVVIGPGHSYASYGGFIAGESNTVTGPSATVSGGRGNAATGFASAVCGGNSNVAEADFAGVMGVRTMWQPVRMPVSAAVATTWQAVPPRRSWAGHETKRSRH